jgi:hypothetical protein
MMDLFGLIGWKEASFHLFFEFYPYFSLCLLRLANSSPDLPVHLSVDAIVLFYLHRVGNSRKKLA